MQEKNQDFSPEAVARLMRSRQAQTLAALLQQMDPQVLSAAASAASQGRTEEAKKLLAPVMHDPRVQELLRGWEGQHG